VASNKIYKPYSIAYSPKAKTKEAKKMDGAYVPYTVKTWPYKPYRPFNRPYDSMALKGTFTKVYRRRHVDSEIGPKGLERLWSLFMIYGSQAILYFKKSLRGMLNKVRSRLNV
jgi:hypothetical protein